MSAVFNLIGLLLWLYLMCLVVRMVLDWVQFFARDWRPRGVVLLLAEGVYTVTDPPLRALRRVIPPLRIGNVGLDLAFMLLFFAVLVASRIFSSL
ncbi:YggT family protein [Xylanimonas oleitrophica]|uniref:YggT family protein n=1 Tax=Xylanimonas oleitrophica TaxID=2607479 RepID=A0A2W5WVF6_9MICO|nr:YggT family protein [Xylanimonas oleitrophica]PZR55449.1 YggT family protein [Xylanimonas oleitrophica]